MAVSKESISKFLIGSRFHVKLRIYSNRIVSIPLALSYFYHSIGIIGTQG